MDNKVQAHIKGSRMAETIVIANQKGGVGKTTTAINLAAALALLKQPTLLIDVDPKGNATSGLGFDHKTFTPSVYNVIVELLPIKNTVKGTIIPALHVCGSGPELIGAEVELVPASARESRLKGALSAVKDKRPHRSQQSHYPDSRRILFDGRPGPFPADYQDRQVRAQPRP
jgi:MinD-like ATPase involved in chromosome partitioning or flagellar assembly